MNCCIFTGRLKYLFLAPIIVMVIFALFYEHMVSEILALTENILPAEHILIAQLQERIHWLTIGFAALILFTFLLNVVFVMLLCHLGSVCKSRNETKRGSGI